MKNSDYKVEFEEHRKEIELEDDRLPSRTERHGKRRKNKQPNTSSYKMINVILGIFTFIPILIFVYVIYNFYFGSDSGSANDNSGFRVEENSSNNVPGKNDGLSAAITDSDKEKEDGKEVDGNTNEDSTSDTGSEKQPAVNVNPETNVNKEPSKPSEEPKEEKKPEKSPEVNQESTTHVVTANETLYRISMNYYGSDAGIAKIKQANGLSSNEIMVGQKLVIPK